MDLYLTPEQQIFAEQNHGLFLKFLSDMHLDEEYYSILIVRYLHTAVRYCVEPELQKYRFSTILWRALRSELSGYWRKARAQPVIMPLDEGYVPPGIDDAPLDDELLRQLEDALTRKQMDAIMLRDQGYTNREIGVISGVSEKAIEKRFHRIRNIIKRRT